MEHIIIFFYAVKCKEFEKNQLFFGCVIENEKFVKLMTVRDIAALG